MAWGNVDLDVAQNYLQRAGAGAAGEDALRTAAETAALLQRPTRAAA